MSPTDPGGPVVQRALLARSASTHRFVDRPHPTTRGWLHLAAAVVAVPGAAVWTALAPPGRPRLAVAAFAWGIAAMFTGSALLHLRRWSVVVTERLVRVDHTGIYLAIAGTGVALALLGFDGDTGRVLLVVAVAGAALGIIAEWLPFAPPRGFSNTVYLTLGWVPVVLLPWLVRSSGWGTVALLLGGGVAYTVGAIVVGLQRPDPVPGRFGYHELFHLLVIVAVALHTVMFADLLAG
ncbi:MAG: hemolysin III family protein [Nitriliruptor sp.]